MKGRILVTGGSGFIAGHTIVLLLKSGYHVRASVRSQHKAAELRATLNAQDVSLDGLSFAEADLVDDAGWAEAMDGCDGVFHMASPFPMAVPKDPREIIGPAVEGTRRIMRFAAEAGVRRVVLTSSLVAISYGRGGRDTPFTEEDWTDPNGLDVSAYVQSKTLAERAAWDFTKENANAPELTVVNPGLVLGPLLSAGHGTSVEVIRKMMAGDMPGAPKAGFCIVDVRDVADMHLRAFESDAAAGERFACCNEWMWLRDMGRTLKARFPREGRKAPTFALPSFLVKLMSNIDKSIKQILIELDQLRAVDNSKARERLGWTPRPAEEAVEATARSLIDFGLT